MIITRTPLRISLIGGGTDVPAFYRKNPPGAVVSFAINKYVYVIANKKFDSKVRVSYSQTENVDHVHELKHELVRETLKFFRIENGIEIASISDIPGNGTGLGSSSSFTVGLVKALGRNIPPGHLAERAYMVEAEQCNHPVGKQDQYSAAHGGFNRFTFYKNSVICVSATWPFPEDWNLLLWTGISRDANEILASQKRSFENGGNTEIGKQMADLANRFWYEVTDEPPHVSVVGEYLREAWKIKKFFANGISNSKIDSIYDIAILAGAIGGKLCGAGGGGFFFFIAPPETHKNIVKATGLRKIDFKIEPNGSEVIYG